MKKKMAVDVLGANDPVYSLYIYIHTQRIVHVIERTEYLYCILTLPTDRIIYYKLLLYIIVYYIHYT